MVVRYLVKGVCLSAPQTRKKVKSQCLNYKAYATLAPLLPTIMLYKSFTIFFKKKSTGILEYVR
jgi:hypothetical protein